MEWVQGFILDIVKLTASGLLVFSVIYLTIRPAIEEGRNLERLNLKKATVKTVLPLRLQAYERMVLFAERINPSAMLLRFPVLGITASELQLALIAEIRNEFQHNITQQIYVSNVTWSVVKQLKEDTLVLINNVSGSIPPDSPSIELSKIILTHLANLDVDPYESSLAIIKQDLQKLF